MRGMAMAVLWLVAGAAAAEAPTVIQVQGRLQNGGGAVTDGTYGATFSIWDSESGGKKLWSETFEALPVLGGLFSTLLGKTAALTADLFAASPDRWLEVSVAGEPPLARTRFASVPYALHASGLQCSGCVAASQLDATVAAKFVDASGDTMSGDLDLGGHSLLNARLHPSATPPAACDNGASGRVYYSAGKGRLYVCDGTAWQRLSVCSEACPAATAVACGVAIASGCGDACPGKGTGINVIQCLSTGGAVCGEAIEDDCGNACGTTGTGKNAAQCSAAATPCGETITDDCGNDCGGTGTLCSPGFACTPSGCKGPGTSSDNPGLSCADVLAKKASVGSGLYWLDPDGAGGRSPFNAFCDMVTDGGGWTLVLHTTYTGSYPAVGALTQGQSDWIDKGIGDPLTYNGITSADFYVMPLASMGSLSGPASSLRFESDKKPIHTILQDFSMNATYSLDGSNETQVKQEMCNGNDNCFVDAQGFSAVGVDNDNYSATCSNMYSSVGWWYDNCFSYNPFYTVDTQHFAGYSQLDATSKHWSWWMR